MLVYVILVAALNLSLGYGAALCLGRGPGRLFSESDATEAPAHDRRRTDSTSESSEPETPEPIAEPLIPESQTEDQPEREKGIVEASIVEFMDGLQNFRSQIADLDTRVRECGDEPDAEAIKERVEDLRSANTEYLKTTQETADLLDEQRDEAGALSDIGEKLRKAIEAQTKNVKATEKNLDNLDVDGDASGTQQLLLREAGQLNRGSCELGESLNNAHLQVARQEGWMDKLDPEMMRDDRTSLYSRAGIEFALEELWRKDPHRSREVSFAMIDIDHCAQLNEQFGPELGDRVIQAVAQVIESSIRQEELAARYQGADFLIMFPDNDPRHSTSAVERMRQVIEATQFQHNSQKIDVTISCAVSQVDSDDSVYSLFERLSHTVQEAKRYGRNRTFLHEGKYPAPVVPPNLTIEGTTYDL